MTLPSGKEKGNLFVLTSFIRGVFDNDGTYSNYSDVLVLNKNRYPSLSTMDTYDYFNDIFDKNGRITYDDVEGRINTDLKMYSYQPIPIPNECSVPTTTAPIYELGVVDTAGQKVAVNDTLTDLCSSLKTVSSYYSSVQDYLIALEKYTVDTASFVKARIDHRVWEKNNTDGTEPIIPTSIPVHPIPPRTPAIPCCGPPAPCCGKRLVDLAVDSDEFDVEIQRCVDKLTRNISDEVIRIQKEKPRREAQVQRALPEGQGGMFPQADKKNVTPPALAPTPVPVPAPPTPPTPTIAVLKAQQNIPSAQLVKQQILKKIIITILVLIVLLILNFALLK
jgi:hypothetical protein